MVVIQRAADMLLLGQQDVIFDIQNSRGVVGALQMQAQPREPVGVIAQHGAVRRAVEAQRGFLHEAQELREFLAGFGALAPDRLKIDPCTVDGVPHLAGQGGAHRARIEPRVFDAVADRGRVFRSKRQIIDDVVLVGVVVDADRIPR